MNNIDLRTAIIAAFVALLASALFLIVVSLPEEATCEEWGYVPVRVPELDDEWSCIPWGDVILDD